MPAAVTVISEIYWYIAPRPIRQHAGTETWKKETYFNFKLQAFNRVGGHLLFYLERPFVSYVDNL